MSSLFQFDATDRSIVELLRKNGRATNLELAENLGLTAATVSTRIKRMEDANQLRVVAVSDFAAHGYNLLMRLAIEVDRRSAIDVAQELSQFPEVFATHLVTGHYEIDLLIAIKDFEDLPALILSHFSSVRGVKSIVPSIVLDIIKYEFEVAPIEPR
jgi:Lrp/AsnC family transcriptional regulator for asnA, asnC and gidA